MAENQIQQIEENKDGQIYTESSQQKDVYEDFHRFILQNNENIDDVDEILDVEIDNKNEESIQIQNQIIKKPAKPSSAFILFMKHLKQDPNFQKEQENQISTIKKKGFLEIVTDKWKELSEQEKKPFELEQARLKQTYLADLEQYNQLKSKLNGEQFADEANEEEEIQMRRKFLQLPLARVRQVCALDDEFRLISKDALLIITKATEMFVTDLAGNCGEFARKYNRKTMQVQDINQVASAVDKFYFIKSSKLPALNIKKNE